MRLFRVFPWDGVSQSKEAGGPLYCPRYNQAKTRYAIPEKDGVLYCSAVRISAVAESLQSLANMAITPRDLRRLPGWTLSMTQLEWPDSMPLLNLCNPLVLAENQIEPEIIATKDRSITQQLAARLFDRDVMGFLWWSSLEASWVNATLFESRAVPHLRVEHIQPLTFEQPEVIEAARLLGIRLES